MIHFLFLLLIKMTRNTVPSLFCPFTVCCPSGKDLTVKWLDLVKVGKNAFFPKTSLRTLGRKNLHFLSSLPPTHKKLDV